MTRSFSRPLKLVVALIMWGGTQPPAHAQGYARQSAEAYYFPLAGHYATKSGLVWVPAPGYYHAAPLVFYPVGGAYPRKATVWRAHPAPWPDSAALMRRRATPGPIHTDWDWHGKAITTQYEHEAWIRRQQAQASRR